MMKSGSQFDPSDLKQKFGSPLKTIRMSPKRTHSNCSSQSEDKMIFNNSPGRLKFFKDGRCLLELTHKESREGSEIWETSTTNNVYWPPSETIKTEGFIQIKSGSLIDGCDSSSEQSVQKFDRTIFKGRPKHFDAQNQQKSVLEQLVFSMKPTNSMKFNRKKVRHLKRKCRRPFSNIFVGALLAQLEHSEKVLTFPPRKQIDIDRIKKSSRLESCIAKLNVKPKVKKPVISIQPWKSGGTKVMKIKPESELTGKSSSIQRIKTELYPVTETCTQDVIKCETPKSKGSKDKPDGKVKLWTPSPKMLPITPTKAAVIKAAGSGGSDHQTSTSLTMPDKQRVKLSIGRQQSSPLQNHLPIASYYNSPSALQRLNSKTVQISPYKSQNVKSGSYESANQNCYSPDLQRVKYELGRDVSPRSPANISKVGPYNVNNTSTEFQRVRLEFNRDSSPKNPRSPMPNSPQNDLINKQHKRLLEELDSPLAKRSRLSTDSWGSSDGGFSSISREGHASPVPRPLGNQSNKSTQFSIDSIINRQQPVLPQQQQSVVPQQQSALAQPTLSTPKPIGQHQSNPQKLIVPITPYTHRGMDSHPMIDPRLAHLAGIAASPFLGLNQIDYMMNPFMAAYLSMASQVQTPSSAGMWQAQHTFGNAEAVPRAPESSEGFTPTPSPPIGSTSQRSSSTATVWGQHGISDIDRSATPSSKSQDSSSNSELPLNLSLKR